MRSAIPFLIMFALANIASFYVSQVIYHDKSVNPYVQFLYTPVEFSPQVATGLILLSILVMVGTTACLVWAERKHPMIPKIFDAVLVASTTSVLFYSIFRMSFGFLESMIAGMGAGAVLSYLKNGNDQLNNLASVLSAISVGAIISANIEIMPIFLIFIVLSFYDVLAVFKTKHMISLANVVIKNKLAMAVRGTMKEGKRSIKFYVGTGDFAASAAICSAAFLQNAQYGLTTLAFSVLGMAFVLYIIRSRKTAIPALPPLVSASLLGYIISILM